MSIFEASDYDGHEKVVFVNQPDYGLRAIIAVHSTALGPAMGGCRMWKYPTEESAIRDVLRLSRSMSYKNATLGLNLGGGKCVVFGDPQTDKTPQMFQALGRAVEQLGGSYIIAEDVGTNPLDMREIKKSTDYVSCLQVEDGGRGDPAPFTALGTLCAIRAGVDHKTGSADLAGLRIAVQGVGNVGFNLCKLLRDAGAELVVSDLDEGKVRHAVEAFGACGVGGDEIYDAEVDVFAPCALGGVINNATLPRLKASVIAGGANNQLELEGEHAEALKCRGIVYIPDFIASGGGVVGSATEWFEGDQSQVEERVRRIFDISRSVVQSAVKSDITTTQAANELAQRRIGLGRDLDS